MNTRDCVDYDSLDTELGALLQGESDTLAMSANFVALLFNAFTDINWLGIYVLRGDELVLGPFQGKPACVHINLGQGVCGTAAEENRTLRIADVHEFAGHIACDPVSKSEIVVPLNIDGLLVGVVDIDSPTRGRFCEHDQQGVEKLCTTFERAVAACRTNNTFI